VKQLDLSQLWPEFAESAIANRNKVNLKRPLHQRAAKVGRRIRIYATLPLRNREALTHV
jgi:phosphoserine aminotransferase